MYRPLLKQWPGHSSYHTGLGVALATQGELDAAVIEFQTAHALTPKRVEPVQDLIQIAIRQNRNDAARQYLHDGIVLDPTNPIWVRLRQQIEAGANSS